MNKLTLCGTACPAAGVPSDQLLNMLENIQDEAQLEKLMNYVIALEQYYISNGRDGPLAEGGMG